MFGKSAGAAVGESVGGAIFDGRSVVEGESGRIARERRRKDSMKRKAKDKIDGREGRGRGRRQHKRGESLCKRESAERR